MDRNHKSENQTTSVRQFDIRDDPVSSWATTGLDQQLSSAKNFFLQPLAV